MDREFALDLQLSGTGLLLGLKAPRELLKIVATVFTTDPDRRRVMPYLSLSTTDVDEVIDQLRHYLERRGRP